MNVPTAACCQLDILFWVRKFQSTGLSSGLYDLLYTLKAKNELLCGLLKFTSEGLADASG